MPRKKADEIQLVSMQTFEDVARRVLRVTKKDSDKQMARLQASNKTLRRMRKRKT